jgi:DNA-binding transcriptional regulator YiaG
MRNLRDFVIIRQAAEMIGVSPATLRDWDRGGTRMSRSCIRQRMLG